MGLGKNVCSHWNLVDGGSCSEVGALSGGPWQQAEFTQGLGSMGRQPRGQAALDTEVEGRETVERSRSIRWR